MKRLLSFLSLLIVAVCTFAQQFTVGDLTYEILSTRDKTAQVYNGKNATGDVVVPETVTYNDVVYSVTTIRHQAFNENKNITSVSLPSVTSIEYDAFRDCYALTSAHLPAATSIGSYAFEYCYALTSAHLPAATSIGTNAFYGCSNITSLRIGSVEQWCNVSFGGAWASPSRSASKPVDLYIGDSETPVTELVVPSTVTNIPDNAFRRTTITSVSAPAATSIGAAAFYECSVLTSAHLPAATSIGSYAFYECSALTSAHLPAATSIGSFAFSSCSNITSLRIGSVEQWCNVSFGNESAIPLYSASKSVDLYIGDSETPVTELVVPSTVTNIPDYAFHHTTITSVTAPSATSIGYSAFYKCSALTSAHLPAATSIGSNAFYDCSALTSADLLAATSIGTQAFTGCSALTSADLPAAVSIGSHAFNSCSNISSLRIGSVEQWCNVSFANNYANPSCSASKPVDLYIGDSETPVTELVVPSTVTKIPDYAFYKTNITSVSAPSVTSIGNYAFLGCSALTSADLPSATSIGGWAFYGCSALTSAHLPAATSIGVLAFSDCRNISSLRIGSVEQWCNVSFGNESACPSCDASKPVDLYIGDSETPVTELVVPSTVTKIPDYAFYRTTITSVSAPSVTSIGNKAFKNCSALTSADLPAATFIGVHAFYDCKKLETVFIPVTVSTVEVYIFEGCLSLSDIYYQGKKEDWSAIAGISNIGIPSTAVIHYSTTPVSDIVLNAQIQTLKVDEIVQLTATVAPEDATNKSIAWTSSNPDVAKVDENGIVTAIAEGTATITATAVVGVGAMASCEITVEGSTPEPPAIDNDYTDITKFENIIFFNEARQWAGKQITLPLMMNNEAEITAMQFDLVLPEGITLDKNARGKYALTFNADANRTDASVHTLSSSLQVDGSIRVLCYSTDKEPFLGNSGALIDFPLTIAEGMEPGDYDIVLKDIILTATDKKEYKMAEVVCKLTVPDYEMGDVNSDEQINVTDIVYTADYILGNADPEFNELAADMNEDGEITVTDIVYIADKILNGEDAANAKSMAKGHAAGDASMTIAPFSIAPGNSKTVTLDMQNEGKEVTAFQCDIILPEGMSISDHIRFCESSNRTDAYTHTLATSQKGGSVKVVCYSLGNDSFLGTEGAILSLPVMADAMMADGVYDIKVENIVMTCKDKTQLKPADVTATVSVGGTTAIDMQGVTPDASAEYYNVGGQQLGNASKGISIIRTDAGVSKVLR